PGRGEADRRARRGQGGRRPRRLRPRALLLVLAAGVPARVGEDGEGAGPGAQSLEARGSVRPAQVLHALRVPDLSRAAPRPAGDRLSGGEREGQRAGDRAQPAQADGDGPARRRRAAGGAPPRGPGSAASGSLTSPSTSPPRSTTSTTSPTSGARTRRWWPTPWSASGGSAGATRSSSPAQTSTATRSHRRQ